LIGINAYHQPGVQAGKKAAEAIIKLQEAILKQLDAAGERPQTVEQIAQAIGRQDECEMIFKICEHLAANPQRRVGRKSGANPFAAGYFRIH
jgi:glucose-6-phosphate isomerase